MAELALSIRETARLLGLSERTVREMVYDGRLPAKRIQTGRGSGKGGRVIIPRSALEEWLSRPDEPARARALRLAWEREAARRPRRAAGAKRHWRQGPPQGDDLVAR